jgi:hypothetical protein
MTLMWGILIIGGVGLIMKANRKEAQKENERTLELMSSLKYDIQDIRNTICAKEDALKAKNLKRIKEENGNMKKGEEQ